MRTKELLMVTVALELFSGAVRAEEAYRVVKIWPEAPQGWHFFKPTGVAIDKSGNVYVGDSGNYRVKKFDSEGRFIIQWGSPGQGDGQFNTIGSVKVDGFGTVYVLDSDWGKSEHCRIQKFTAYGQFLGQFERKAPDANRIKYPVDLTSDRQGNILVLAVDYQLKLNRTYDVRIERYSPQGEFLSQWGAQAGSGDGQFQKPGSIAVDTEGNIYITEMANGRVQKFDSSGKFLTKWGALGTLSHKGDGIFGGGARSVALDQAGDVYVLDGSSVQKFTAAGEFLARWKTPGSQARRLAVDSHGNVYVTHENSHEVVRLDPKGSVISQWGCGGAEDGLLSLPGSIVVGPSGHIFVADSWNYRIQRFDSEGQFLSRWGDEFWFGITGLATGASGDLYVTLTGPEEVQRYNRDRELIGKWGSSGSEDGQFQYLRAIAVGPSGNVYVADGDNGRVQKFTADGKFLAKWETSGTENGQFAGTFFIAADDSGHVWVGDQLDVENRTHRMQKFDANGKFLTQWKRNIMIPGGSRYIGAVAVDSSGNSYYVFERRVEKYDAGGNLIDSYGQGGFPEDRLERVVGVCVDKAGCLYVTEGSGSIRKFDSDGRLADTWTAKDTEGQEKFPKGPMVADAAGNLYVSPWTGVSIWKLLPGGKTAARFQITAPPRGGRFTELGGVTVDRAGNVYVVESVDVDWEYGIPSIQKFGSTGRFVMLWGLPEAAKNTFKYPVQIAADGAGNLYVTDQSTHRVHKLDPQGKYVRSWGEKGTGDGQFDTPEGVVVDGSGHVYVCDRQNSRIQKFDSDGKFLAKWGKEGSGDGEFHFPAAVAVDNKGHVFVADSENHRIQKFASDGQFLTKWGEFGEAPGQLNVPLGIAVDQEGNVYVSDSHNQRIQKFAPAASR
jgi:tripartite motif-containing protein 71